MSLHLSFPTYSGIRGPLQGAWRGLDERVAQTASPSQGCCPLIVMPARAVQLAEIKGNGSRAQLCLDRKTKRVLCVLSQEFIAEAGAPGWGPSVLLIGDVEAQGGAQGEVSEEGAGQVLDLGVGAQCLEVLHVVPEVRGGEGPVGHGGQLGVGVWKTRGSRLGGWATGPARGRPPWRPRAGGGAQQCQRSEGTLPAGSTAWVFLGPPRNPPEPGHPRSSGGDLGPALTLGDGQQRGEEEGSLAPVLDTLSKEESLGEDMGESW